MILISHPASFPNADTQAYRILELTAICGELPTDLLSRLPGSDSYKEVVITSLKKDGLIRTHYKDRLRAYRLSRKAKDCLLSQSPDRFSFYLSGNADTNRIRSEVPRRLRLHRIAESYVLMQNAGVSIFRDEKPFLFLHELDEEIRLTKPAFYSSREIKELGVETVKIRGSRMTGALVRPGGCYVVYNTGGGLMEFDFRAEQRTSTLLNYVLCNDRLSSYLSYGQIYGLLTGKGMEPLVQILTSADTGARCFFLLDGDYPHFYYFTNDNRGEMLLKLLTNPKKTQMLNRVLSNGLRQKAPGFPMEHDALDEDGNPVLFEYLLDMPRISRFYTALQLQGRTGTVICFDYQEEAMRPVFGQELQFQTISYKKFEGSIFNR